MNETISIKENASLDRPNLGLEKEGRSKMPGCYDIIQPSKGKDGRWVTGIDELSYKIATIKDPVRRQELFDQVKAEREYLEEHLGQDLSGLSKFWESYYIYVDRSVSLDLSKPEDRLKYRVLQAGDAVAPDYRAAQDMTYKDAKYYMSREFDDVSDRVSRTRAKDDAIVELKELLKHPDKALLVGRYLNLNIKANTPPDNVYDAFRTYLDTDQKTGAIDKFMAGIARSPEEISIKLLFDDAMFFSVIRQRDGLFQRGDITLGRTPADAIAFLTNPRNSGEMLSIQDEVEMKRKFG